MQYDINYIQFLFKEFDRLSRKMASVSLSILALNVKDHNQRNLCIYLSHLREEKNQIMNELNDFAHDIWITDLPLNIKSI